MQYIDEFLKWVESNKDWVFDGIGVTIGVGVTGFLSRFLVQRKKGSEKKEGNILNEIDNKTGDISGSGNICGNGNVNGNIINIYNKDVKEQEEEKESSWFSKRFYIMLDLLNEARDFTEKEYTVEYVSSLIGLKNVGELKKYLESSEEPDNDFKEKFVEVFGVNRDWMVFGQGENPFLSNIEIFDNNPMDILRKENLKEIKSFTIIIGIYEHKRYACIIRKKRDFCYEIYPVRYILYSKVGGSGRHKLVEFYRFVREAEKIKKLEFSVYEASEKQFVDLFNGKIAPKKVKKFDVSKWFVDKFLDLSLNSIDQNARFWDEDLVRVQRIIKSNLPDRDMIDQESDMILINKNLGKCIDGNRLKEKTMKNKEIPIAKRDIDGFDSSTRFFDYRFAKAFPGVRGIKEFIDHKECVDRLEILLRTPLRKKGLTSPIWWFRGSSNLYIHKFSRLSESKFLMNCDEIEINRVVVYGAAEYYKKFVYVEANPEKSIGLYDYMTEDYIEEYKKAYGEYHEEYALYNGRAITRAEYDDDAAVIDGKVVDLENEAELRVRYLTPYNFIICAQFNPINKSENDSIMKRLLNGILEGKHTVEDIVEFVDGLDRHRKDI